MPAKDIVKKRKVSAWAVSIAVHVIALIILAFVQFSRGVANTAPLPTPKASIKQVKKTIERETIVPKPKIKRKLSDSNRPKRKNLFASSREIVRKNSSNAIAVSNKDELENLFRNSSSNINTEINFFGNKTYQRKICYVVDCSGSMLGLFRQVRLKLIESVSSLRPDNYFDIIIFRGGQTIQLSNGNLLRATPLNIKKAIEMLNKSPRPLGAPDALSGIQKALKTKAPSGYSPDVIYFLTDGFDFSADENENFAHNVQGLRDTFAPSTRIHTIGFWTNKRDEAMLREIALNSQGKFVNYIDNEK